MRILTALTYYRPHYSGLTVYAERVARALAQRGHQVTVLTSRFSPRLPATAIEDGVQVLRQGVLLRISKGVIMPGMLVQAWKYARSADVIHLHVPQLDAAPIALIGRLLGKRVVLTYHCDLHLPQGFIHRLANWVSNVANHLTAALAHAIIHSTSDYAAHSPFLKRYLKKVHIIPCPIDMAPASATATEGFLKKIGYQPGQRLIGMTARLASEKGVEYLAQALPAVLQRLPTARVLFVGTYQNVMGEEAYAARLAPLIASLGEHWTFLGNISSEELTAFFRSCEVTVLPSINSTESYGIVQVESMSCGTPVVASALPGIRVPIQQTAMGCLVPPRHPAHLAQAILQVLENPAQFQGNPQELLRQSSAPAVAQAYEKIYTSQGMTE